MNNLVKANDDKAWSSESQESKDAQAQIDRLRDEDEFYTILQIDRQAEPRRIKLAFFELSKLLHPDKCKLPGAEEAYSKICQAYQILMDKDSRAHYDQFGQVKDDSNEIENEARSNLISLVFEFIEQVHETEIGIVDPFPHITKLINTKLANLDKDERNCKKKKRKLLKLKARFVRRTKAPNFISGAIDQKIRSCEEELEEIEKLIKIGKRMLDLKSEFTYTLDEVYQPVYSTNATTSAFSPMSLRGPL